MAPRRLWLGGSSGLARTYLNAFDEEWILVGHEAIAPAWMPSNCQYTQCDLLHTPPSTFWKQVPQPQDLDVIVVGIRPPLVTSQTHAQALDLHRRLVDGLRAWLAGVPSKCRLLHISSIAAIGHLAGQVQVKETDPEPSLRSLESEPYDWFKKACEDLLPATSLRLGAIFSDAPTCIQCSALALQANVGLLLPHRIDCNSAWNVAQLIHAMLASKTPWKSVYYYTRPLRLGGPVPYGDYLVAYRQAYGIPDRGYVELPLWFVQGFVALVHFVARYFGTVLPFVASIDYLLQVSTKEHSFDLSRVSHDFDFPEESLTTCFRRRRKALS